MNRRRNSCTTAMVILFALYGAYANDSDMPSSEEFFRSVTIALQDPEQRKELKAALQSWSPTERQEFSSNLSTQFQSTLVQKLPMQIDAATVWQSFRMTDSAMYADITIIDQNLANVDAIGSLEESFKNRMCSTPANALLLMLGYKMFLSYYDNSSKYITQLQYTEESCGF